MTPPETKRSTKSTRCPACDAEVPLPELTRGISLTCPACGQQLRVSSTREARTNKRVNPRLFGSGETDPLIGSTLGGCRIISVLGKGGMGVVYRAQHTAMDREVAIKVLPSEFSQERKLVKRFVREARLAGGISHPNLVEVYDVRATADGIYFIVMELVQGSNLEQLVKRDGPMAPDQAAELIRQAAVALGAAHKRGVIHRDIKPANLMLEGDRVKVADFGLASGIIASDEVATGIVGTPQFMAPECVQGGEIDARTDLYALGISLHFLLAGDLPFSGSIPVVLMKQIQEPLPPIAGVPPALQAIVLRLTAKQPGARFQNAPATVEALNNYLKYGDAPAEVPTSTTTKAASSIAPARRPSGARQRRSAPAPAAPPLAAIGAIAGAALIVGALAFLLWPAKQRPTAVVIGGSSSVVIASQSLPPSSSDGPPISSSSPSSRPPSSAASSRSASAASSIRAHAASVSREAARVARRDLALEQAKTDPQGALEALRSYLADHGRDELALRAAINLARKHAPDDAAIQRWLSALAELAPQDAKVHDVAGVEAFEARDYARAAKHFARADGIEPSAARAARLVTALLRAGELDDAIEVQSLRRPPLDKTTAAQLTGLRSRYTSRSLDGLPASERLRMARMAAIDGKWLPYTLAAIEQLEAGEDPSALAALLQRAIWQIGSAADPEAKQHASAAGRKADLDWQLALMERFATAAFAAGQHAQAIAPLGRCLTLWRRLPEFEAIMRTQLSALRLLTMALAGAGRKDDCRASYTLWRWTEMDHAGVATVPREARERLDVAVAALLGDTELASREQVAARFRGEISLGWRGPAPVPEIPSRSLLQAIDGKPLLRRSEVVSMLKQPSRRFELMVKSSASGQLLRISRLKARRLGKPQSIVLMLTSRLR